MLDKNLDIQKCNSPVGEASTPNYTLVVSSKDAPQSRSKKPKYVGPPVYIGLDAEWVTHAPELGIERPWNRILSYQLVLDCGGQRVSDIIYPPGRSRKRRLTFGHAIRRVLKKARKAGVIQDWPDQVTVFGHFLRADLAAFYDFWERKREFDSTGKTFMARSVGIPVEGGQGADPASDDRKRNEHSETLVLLESNASYQVVRVRFVDTLLLTPGRAGLETVGRYLEIVKLDLPPGYSKDRMDKLLREQPDAFEEYAIRDAEIALEYGLRMEQFTQAAGLDHLPATLAGFGPALLRKEARDNDLDLNHALGLRQLTKTRYSEKTGKYRTIKELASVISRQIFEEFAAAAYHGGRNECYFFGPTPVSTYYDFDLPGAYTTAMCSLRPLDYEKARTTQDLSEFTVDTLGLAVVRFAFPEATRFPCLPVRTDNGLIFPLEGESVCTAPEIFLAQRLGAQIEIVNGLIIPWANEERLFEPFTHLIQRKRKEARQKHGPGSLEEKLWKEIGNSLYGKTAQGVREKRVFNSRRGYTEELRPSSITNPFYASYVTGFIRAVLGELLEGVPDEFLVVSATTDGFLTNAPLKVIDTSGPLCAAFMDLRERLFGEREILEEKHRAAQVLAMRTRGQLTAEACGDGDIILAKAGVKPPSDADDPNEYMVNLFLGRTPGQRHEYKSLISLREMWLTESDMVSVLRGARLNLDFDMKRQPVRPIEQSVRGGRHLAFQTRPWQTVEEALMARVQFDGWRKGHDGLLKTLADFDAWSAYRAQMKLGRNRGIGIRRDGSRGMLKRLFLRAFVRNEWGIDNNGWSYDQLAFWLSSKGIKTSEMDVKNAARPNAKLVRCPIALHAETLELLRVIVTGFPHFDLSAIVPPEQLSEVRNQLGL